MLGVALLVVAVVIVVRPWFANVFAIVPTEAEVTESIARLIAGAIALVSLTAASYLTLKEWSKAKHRRAKANEEGRS